MNIGRFGAVFFYEMSRQFNKLYSTLITRYNFILTNAVKITETSLQPIANNVRIYHLIENKKLINTFLIGLSSEQVMSNIHEYTITFGILCNDISQTTFLYLTL